VSGHLSDDVVERAHQIIDLYPHKRSALIPLCHLAQEQDGWLMPEAVDEIAALLGITPAEVVGTASFYDMLHTEPTGKYLVSVCTNIACMLRGAYELLEHAEAHLGMRAGATSPDGTFTLEEAECLADCGRAPCLQVNHRFFGDVSHEDFDRMTEDLSAGRLSDVVPPHGTLVRVRRTGGLAVSDSRIGAGTPNGTGSRNGTEKATKQGSSAS
jgi:NADH-quinone oxidoreductase subunit E